jgi:hypothetical protein
MVTDLKETTSRPCLDRLPADRFDVGNGSGTEMTAAPGSDRPADVPCKTYYRPLGCLASPDGVALMPFERAMPVVCPVVSFFV